MNVGSQGNYFLAKELGVSTVTSQAVPAVNEVAIAAADSAFPVAALQHLIDGVHSFTGLNWWASIALRYASVHLCFIYLVLAASEASTGGAKTRDGQQGYGSWGNSVYTPQSTYYSRPHLHQLFLCDQEHGRESTVI
ncbi:hypothetical protein Bca101_058841 [Brassica carinata]